MPCGPAYPQGDPFPTTSSTTRLVFFRTFRQQPGRPKKKPRKGSRGSTEMDGDPALPGLGRFSAAPNTETCVPRDKSSLLAARRCSQYSHHLCSGPGAPETCIPRDKSSLLATRRCSQYSHYLCPLDQSPSDLRPTRQAPGLPDKGRSSTYHPFSLARGASRRGAEGLEGVTRPVPARPRVSLAAHIAPKRETISL